MKILTNTNLHSNGGIAKRANEMIRYCEKNDIDLTVVGINPSEDYLMTRRGSVKIYQMPLELGDSGKHGVYKKLVNLKGLEKRLSPTMDNLRRVIDKEKPDVILSEGTFYIPWMLHKISKDLGIPTIVLYAGVLTKEEEKAPGKLRNMYNQMEGDFNRSDDFYIFPSELTRREVEKIFKRKLEDSVVIPNGISREFFKKSGTKRNPKSVGFVGRSHHIKNMEFLINLARDFKRRMNNFEISAVSRISSKRNQKYMEDEGVKIIEEMPTEDLGEFYKKMGVVISPSHFETYGNVPIEAVAAGTPALVGRNMGVSETFTKLGLERFIIEDFNDVQEVSERVEELSNYSVTNDTTNQIQSRFKWSDIMERYFNYITSLSIA